MKRRKGKLTRRNKRLARIEQEKAVNPHPQCIVVTRGDVGKNLKRLSRDFRKVMEPNTSTTLQEKRKNVVRDFVAVAGQLNVTHIVMFSETKVGLYMKFARIPQGPTLTFRILKYSLKKDVLASLKRQFTPSTMHMSGPCLMTNLQPNDGPPAHQLAARMFLDLFPTITPNTTKTEAIQRCCLIHYDDDDTEHLEEEKDVEGEEDTTAREKLGGLFDLRHYAIRVVSRGESRAIRKLSKRLLPDLSGYADVADFITRAGAGSESEGEDNPAAQVMVSDRVIRTHIKGTHKASIRLYEVGPRLTLRLVKIEEGLLEGATLYNNYFSLTDEEKLELENKRRMKMQLKMKRKEEQEKNVEAKKKKKEEHRRRCLEGMRVEGDEMEPDDDRQYYRDEVGEDPDPDLFQKRTPGKRKAKDGEESRKKLKKDTDAENSDDHEGFAGLTRRERKEKKIMLAKERRARKYDKKEGKLAKRKKELASGRKMQPKKGKAGGIKRVVSKKGMGSKKGLGKRFKKK